MVGRVKRDRNASLCQISSKSVKPLPIWASFRFFQDGGCPPSEICYGRVRTTHEGYLVVFITVQNLVGIDAAVLIICMFCDFTSLAWKRLFTPPKLGFWGIWPLNGEPYQRNPKRHTLRESASFERKSVDVNTGVELPCSPWLTELHIEPSTRPVGTARGHGCPKLHPFDGPWTWQQPVNTSNALSNPCNIIKLPFNGLFYRTIRRILLEQETMGWQWHRLDYMHIICTSLQTDNHTNISYPVFYRPDALPDTQPTVSRHCNKCMLFWA